jgi:L-rhamnose isomerase/sugar isomerase
MHTRLRKSSPRLNPSALSYRPGGFANSGTRFGKFIQPAAATTTEEKFSDAGQVHLLTGVCPTIALPVLWDCPEGVDSAGDIQKFTELYRVRFGSINPNLFQEQEYKYGSFGNPDPAIRQRALQHTKDSIQIARRLHSRDISMWFADGSNYPGTRISGSVSNGSPKG